MPETKEYEVACQLYCLFQALIDFYEFKLFDLGEIEDEEIDKVEKYYKLSGTAKKIIFLDTTEEESA